MLLIIVVPLAIAFWAGVFSTSFDLNLCYSNAMQTLSKEAQYARTHPEYAPTFDKLLQSLRFEGYETECKPLARAIEAVRPPDLKE
jgi:hypothetical protein